MGLFTKKKQSEKKSEQASVNQNEEASSAPTSFADFIKDNNGSTEPHFLMVTSDVKVPNHSQVFQIDTAGKNAIVELIIATLKQLYPDYPNVGRKADDEEDDVPLDISILKISCSGERGKEIVKMEVSIPRANRHLVNYMPNVTAFIQSLGFRIGAINTDGLPQYENIEQGKVSITKDFWPREKLESRVHIYTDLMGLLSKLMIQGQAGAIEREARAERAAKIGVQI